MNRQLNCSIARAADTPLLLAEELVQYGFIHSLDSRAIQVGIIPTLTGLLSSLSTICI